MQSSEQLAQQPSDVALIESAIPSPVRTAPRMDEVSIVTLAISLAFKTAMNNGNQHLFNPVEITLWDRFFNAGKASLPWSKNWFLMEGLSLAVPTGITKYFLESQVTPDYCDIVMRRQLMMNNQVAEAIANGSQQIVFLRGGFNGSPLALALQNPAIKFFELDKADNQTQKLKGLLDLPPELSSINIIKHGNAVKINENMVYIPAELNANLKQNLINNGFDPALKTLIIADGVSGYLTAEQNNYLMLNLSDLLKDNDQLIISYMTSMRTINPVEAAALAEANEQHKFALPLDSFIPYLGAANFNATGKYSAFQDAQANPEEKEFFVFCTKGSANLTQSFDDLPIYTLPQLIAAEAEPSVSAAAR